MKILQVNEDQKCRRVKAKEEEGKRENWRVQKEFNEGKKEKGEEGSGLEKMRKPENEKRTEVEWKGNKEKGQDGAHSFSPLSLLLFSPWSLCLFFLYFSPSSSSFLSHPINICLFLSLPCYLTPSSSIYILSPLPSHSVAPLPTFLSARYLAVRRRLFNGSDCVLLHLSSSFLRSLFF